MKKIASLRLCIFMILLSVGINGNAQESINNYFESIKKSEVLLQQFFSYMPKGGDLHNHLTGSAYAETYFSIGVKDFMWVDMNTGKLYKAKPSGNTMNLVQLRPDMDNLHIIRMRLIDIWSIRNYQPHKSILGADEYFFDTFGLFSAATNDHLVDLLKELRKRAAVENVQYLEIMATSPKVKKENIDNIFGKGTYDKQNKSLQKSILTNDPFLGDTITNIFKSWNTNKDMHKLVKNHIDLIDSLDINSVLKDNKYKDPLCLYQSYASRNADPLMVFVQLFISFKACEESEKLVGVNIVSAENGENSMLYYDGHMKMFDYLSKVYPKVKKSLHAGELTIGLVMPENMDSHIRKAVYDGKADRIGHGVDIAFEKGSVSLLNEMKRRKTAVEINLVSNEFILGVKDDKHPFPLYFKAGVPMVISTDDPGILRTNLIEQYVLLTLRYGITYDNVKDLVRNSIIYSFIPEPQKKELLTQLDNEIDQFENEWALNINTEMKQWKQH